MNSLLNFLTPEIGLLIVIALSLLFFIVQLLSNLKLRKEIAVIPHVAEQTETKNQMKGLSDQITQLQSENKKLAEAIELLLPKSQTIKKSALVRYNPFRDSGVGGLQSFSVANIDENGNGVVISHLYSREMTRVTAKEIKEWNPTDQELSPEEKESIQKTKTK